MAGKNSVYVKLMKLDRYIIADHISWLINCSFTTGVFTNILKQSCITPVFKNGDRGLMSNYRTISILPILSKIFEKSMSTRILHYASKFSILSPWQFGFRGECLLVMLLCAIFVTFMRVGMISIIF